MQGRALFWNWVGDGGDIKKEKKRPSTKFIHGFLVAKKTDPLSSRELCSLCAIARVVRKSGALRYDLAHAWLWRCKLPVFCNSRLGIHDQAVWIASEQCFCNSGQILPGFSLEFFLKASISSVEFEFFSPRFARRVSISKLRKEKKKRKGGDEAVSFKVPLTPAELWKGWWSR